MALGYIPDLQHTEFDFCEYYEYGKQTRNTHSTHYNTLREPLELIHMDLCGPMPKKSLGGDRYFITFIDDATRQVWAYLLKTKDEALSTFTRWCTEVELQTGRKVKTLHSDNEDEYTSGAFTKYLSNKGILHQWSAPYKPMQNIVVESMNRTIPKRVTAVLQHAKLKTEFWAEAMQTIVYVINLSPSTSVGQQAPQGLWSRQTPWYDRLRIFGCEEYMSAPKGNRQKLAPRSTKCIFLGYGTDGQFGYQLWDLELQRLVRSNDLVFNEHTIFTDKIRPKSEKQVNFDLTPANPEDHANKSPGNTENMSCTTPED